MIKLRTAAITLPDFRITTLLRYSIRKPEESLPGLPSITSESFQQLPCSPIDRRALIAMGNRLGVTRHALHKAPQRPCIPILTRDNSIKARISLCLGQGRALAEDRVKDLLFRPPDHQPPSQGDLRFKIPHRLVRILPYLSPEQPHTLSCVPYMADSQVHHIASPPDDVVAAHLPIEEPRQLETGSPNL